MRGTKDFDAVDVRLPELDVEEWGPLVFVKVRDGVCARAAWPH